MYTKRILFCIFILFFVSINLSKETEEVEITGKMLSVMIENEHGEYEKSSSDTLPKNMLLDIDNTYCINGSDILYDPSLGQVVIDNNISDKCVLYFKELSHGPFASLILENNGGIDFIKLKESPDFNKAAISESDYDNYSSWCNDSGYCDITRVTKNENGMYVIDENDGKSYYFRGYVDNNWVIFGEENGEPIYWRIVRIEGNGNVKLIYSGTTAPSSSESFVMTGTKTQASSTSTYQNITSMLNDGKLLYQSVEGVGYVYEDGVLHGSESSSLIKSFTENWYNNNLSLFSDYIAPHETCIDRTIYTREGLAWDYTFTRYSVQDIIDDAHYYGATKRLWRVANTNPILSCDENDDSLLLDVSLITVDEVSLAGGLSNLYNSSFYLYTGVYYWTISPYYFDGTNAYVFRVNSSGNISYNNIVYSRGVRYVISLDSTVDVVSGNGTYNNPYIISTEV